MGKNVADIKLTANSGIELPLPNPKDVKKVLILGNTIGFFGYPGEGCNISNIHGEDAKRFAWMYNCALLGVEIEILGEIEEFEYYSDLFQKFKERYGYEADATFVEMKKNEDYDTALETYIDEMEDTGKKRFDYAIMNPPYDRNLHLKFLEKVIKVAGKTVNISPVRWLQDPLARYKKNSDLNRYRSSIIDHIEKIDFLHSKRATDIFGGEGVVVFKSDLGIYTCSDKGGYNPNTFSNPIMDKVVNSKYCGIPTMKKSQCVSGNFCILNDILGNHSGTAGFGNYMPLIKSVDTYGKYYYQGKSEKNGKTMEENKAMNSHSVNGKTDNWTVVSLNTKNELLNFYNSTETTFFKYIFCVSLVDVHVHPQFLPWMGDYTKPWTNARFCEYFGITGFVSDTEAEPGSEWETILETMKKYV